MANARLTGPRVSALHFADEDAETMKPNRKLRLTVRGLIPRSTPYCGATSVMTPEPPLRPIADCAAFLGGDHPESMPSYWRKVSYGELDIMTGTDSNFDRVAAGRCDS